MSPPRQDGAESIDDQVDQVADDAEAMNRPNRAIPLPDDRDDDEDGVGPTTGLVP
ncbi:MAG TPA: hypothetical protein VLJ13_10735 [Brevundimonas sp.]|nr:hypothetical protein [Brevundimonas sp.]